MARHPKKKKEEKKPDDDNVKDNPSETSIPAKTDETKIKNGLDKLFWLRVGMGILAGTLSAETGSSIDPSDFSSRILLGFGIMIVLFIVSYVIAKRMNIQMVLTEKKKLVTTGYGSYFLMFIFSWILVNTLIHPDVGIHNIR